MADINDELDALFDDDETEQEEAVEEAVAEEEAEASEAAEPAPKAKAKAKLGSKMAGKKTKVTGARTGSIPIGKKAAKGVARTRPGAAKPSKAAPKPEPEPEPEEAAPTRSVRTKVVPPAAGGGKGLLVVSLVLNVLLLGAVIFVAMGVAECKSGLAEVKNSLITVTNVSRVKLGVFMDRGNVENAALVVIPKDVSDIGSDSNLTIFPVKQLDRKKK